VTDARPELVELARTAVAEKATKRWEWAEVRPIPLGLPPAYPIVTDCDGAVTIIYHEAGCQDPNGQNYDGEGWSEDFFIHGSHIAFSAVLAGDVVTFGPSGEIHTAMFVQSAAESADPLCFSHGKEGDPSLVPLSALEGLGIATFLRFSTLKRELLPDAGQLDRRNFEALPHPLVDVPVVLHNGWHVWKWTGWQFVVVDRHIPGAAVYADKRWHEKVPK
jgi:hypothetical protein